MVGPVLFSGQNCLDLELFSTIIARESERDRETERERERERRGEERKINQDIIEILLFAFKHVVSFKQLRKSENEAHRGNKETSGLMNKKQPASLSFIRLPVSRSIRHEKRAMHSIQTNWDR